MKKLVLYGIAILMAITLVISCDNAMAVKTYTVTFESDGGSTISSQLVIENKTATMPTNPTKEGYIFGGWYTEINGGGTEFTANTKVTGDITVYAKWDLYSYIVTFDNQDATTLSDPISKSVISPNTTVDVLPTAPEKTGYTFGGWYTEVNGEGTEFTANTKVTSDITVYAKWDLYSYIVTFDNQDATTLSDPISKSVISPNTTVDVLPTAPEKTGYTFGGWYTEVNGEGTEFTANTKVTSDITVYAKWFITRSKLKGTWKSVETEEGVTTTTIMVFEDSSFTMNNTTQSDSLLVETSASGTYTKTDSTLTTTITSMTILGVTLTGADLATVVGSSNLTETVDYSITKSGSTVTLNVEGITFVKQ